MGYLEQVVCEKLGPKNAYQYFTFVIGCYPCLYCLVFHENMVKPLSARGHAPPRTYESICTDHQRYIASGVSRKQVQHFYNCITEPIFNIPIEQVNMSFVFCITTHTFIHTHTRLQNTRAQGLPPPRASHHIGHLYKALWFA